jgi:hypothetical protein
MDQPMAVIIAALVAAVGSIIVALLGKVRKENKGDHELVMALLRIVGRKQDRLEGKLDSLSDRLSDHLRDDH